MAKQSKITRDEIADKKVLELGKDYAKSLKPAIDANERWLKSFGPIKAAALEYAKIEKQFKVSKDRKEFLQLKKAEEDLRKQAANAVKAEQQALAQFNKVKQEEQKIRKQAADAAKAEERAKQSVIDTDRKQLQLENQVQAKKKRSIKLTEEEKLEIRLLNRGKREAAVISSKLSTEYEKQSKRLIVLKREYKDVALTQGQTSEKAEKLRKEIQRLDTALKDVDGSVGEFQRNVGNYKSAMTSAARAARSLAQEMGAVGGAFLVAAVIRDAFNRVREFDKEMQKLAGLSGTTRGELKDLEEAILDVAAASISTSNDIAKLATVLVQMGKTKEEVIALLGPVNNLALGLDTTAEQAGEFLIQTLNAFGKGAESGQEFADIIAKISNETALNFQRMVDAFPYLTAVSHQLGLELEDVGALIGVLNDNGIKAQSSGRLLGTSFSRMAREGHTLEEALTAINEAQKSGADGMEVLAVANEYFSGESAKLGVILAANQDKIAAYAKSFENAGGSLKKLTDEQLKSLDAQLKILDSAWEEYLLSTNDATGASNALREAVSFLSANLKTIINTIIYATTIWAGYKGIVFLSRLQTGLMTKSLATQRLVALANAKGISTARLAWVKFSRVLKANAIGLAITAIAALVYILAKYNKSLEEIHKANQQQLKDFKKNAEAKRQDIRETNALIDRYDELRAKTDLNKDEQAELNSILLKLKGTVPDVVKEFDEYGKVIGINTTKLRDMNKAQLEGLKYQAKVGLKSNKEELEKLIEQREFLRVQIEGLKAGEGDEFLGIQIYTDEDFADAYKKLNTISQSITETEKAISDYEKTLSDVSQTLQDDNQITGETVEVKTKQLLTVKELRTKISELNKEKETLTINDKARASEIEKLIEKYKKQINAILGVSAANTSAEESAKKRLEAERKLAADAFELQKFILEQKILSENAIVESEDESWAERRVALDARAVYQLQLAQLVAERKLEQTKTFSDQELSYFKETGELTKEQLKSLTDEQLLIYKQFQARKKEITGQKEEGQDNLEVEQLKAEAEIQKDLTEKRLNDEIRAENEAFAKKQGIYAKVENAVETHERRVAEIKKKYALQGLNAQVAAIEELLQSEELSAQQRAEYEKQLAEIKRQISELNLEYFIDNAEKRVLTEEEKAQQILDIAGQLAGALTNLANAIFEARIQEIDEEIAKNEEKYERWLENENLSEEQRKEIEKQREKDRQELEKKKRKEQRKQAILNKAMAIVEIGINTAIGMMQAYAQLGPIGGTVGAALVAALGAIQTAAVIAKPIPKYAKGTKNHIGGPALVGEERPEVVEEPGKDPYVVSKPSVLDLPKGTRVTPSLEEYERLMRASVLASIDIENKKLNDFQARQAFDDSRMIVEMQLTREAIKNNKTRVIVNQSKPPDIDHELFRYKNTNWS